MSYYGGFNRVSKSDKYKYVSKYENVKGQVKWNASIDGFTKYFEEEREAAKWIDLKLIEKGKNPVNVLIRK